MRIGTQVKAGGVPAQHNETLKVRTQPKAGGVDSQHNETLRRTDIKAIAVRRELRRTAAKEDRLELLVIRAGLRAGARRFRRHRN